MPDENSTHQLDYNGWIMRVLHARQAPSRLVVLLHGWTGDENSMWVFARNFPEDRFIIAPRAPHPIERGGYSWRALAPGTSRLPTLLDLKPAAVGLIRLVDDLSASLEVDASQFELAGFSQGGALANVMALLYPGRIRRMAILAGFMPDGVETLLERKVLKDKPVFVAHGAAC